MEFCTIHKEALDKETIKKKINQGIDVHFKMPNKDILAIRRSNDLHFLMKEPVVFKKLDGTTKSYPDILCCKLTQKEEVKTA